MARTAVFQNPIQAGASNRLIEIYGYVQGKKKGVAEPEMVLVIAACCVLWPVRKSKFRANKEVEIFLETVCSIIEGIRIFHI